MNTTLSPSSDELASPSTERENETASASPMMIMCVDCPEDKRALVTSRIGFSQIPPSILKLIFSKDDVLAHFVLIEDMVLERLAGVGATPKCPAKSVRVA